MVSRFGIITIAIIVVATLTMAASLVDSFIPISSPTQADIPHPRRTPSDKRSSAPLGRSKQARFSIAVGISDEITNPTPLPPQHYASISSVAESVQEFAKRLVSFGLDLPSGTEQIKLESSRHGDSHVTYLVHTGPTTPLIIRAASVAAFTLARIPPSSSSWSTVSSDGGDERRDDDDDDPYTSCVRAFERSVREVVRSNPILTGRAVSVPSSGGGTNARKSPWGTLAEDIVVVPGAFPPDGSGRHSFVRVIDLRRSATPSPKGRPAETLLDYVDAYVSPTIPDPCAPTIRQIRDGSPLFRTEVVLLPDNYVCFYVSMSHCLGDISTFMTLLDQLSSSSSLSSSSHHSAGGGRHKPRTIDWDSTIRSATHQISPPDFSDRDSCVSYGLPFFVGLVVNAISKAERTNRFVALSREKIRAKRMELSLRRPSCYFSSDADAAAADLIPTEKGQSLSSNDVITAALCEACQSSDIFAFTRNLRESHHTQYKDMAGNLYIEVPFAREAGCDPNTIRRIMTEGHYYERDRLPPWPFLVGRVGRISSCVAPRSMKFDFGTAKTVCHCPPKNFLDSCPFDCAVIFNMDDNRIGVMHNFWKVDETGLLGQLKA